MLYNFQRTKLCRHLLVGGVLCAAGLGVFSCTDKYDLDDDQPSGLNSIYGYMRDQGNYSTCLKLIDDLGMSGILSKTGSKTLFIADNAAFERFFRNNEWGVSKYSDLSLAQKKLLLNSAMLDNPYTTAMLTSAAGDDAPVPGRVFRRSSSVSMYDSVLVIPKADPDGILPKNSRFEELHSVTTRDSTVMFTDDSGASPMLHFTSKFLSTYQLEKTDIDFLYNQPAGTFDHDDVYVNNTKVLPGGANIFCKNGFIHKVEEVVLPLDNMAEIIRKHDNMSLYNSMLDRFACVDFDKSKTLTLSYQRNKGSQIDSVFTKRYYADRVAGAMPGQKVEETQFKKDKNGKTFDGYLKFDPGWNLYNSGSKSKGDTPLKEDMAVMIVPSNQAVETWWNGEGAIIQEIYGSYDNIPITTLEQLIRVNQHASFVSSVPSRFSEMKDDAQEELGLTTDDIDHVYLGSNGVVYLTNRLLAPKSFSSVLYPAQVDVYNFNLIYNALKNLDYGAYLGSMVTQYIFVLPTNDGMLSYIDPVSYGQSDYYLWEFSAKPNTGASSTQYLQADVYKCTVAPDGTVTKGEAVTKTPLNPNVSGDGSIFKDRFEDMLDNIICVEPYQEGKKYYKTKGNTFLRVDGYQAGSNVYGGWQQEHNNPLEVQRTYEMANGKTLVVNGIPMGGCKSVAKVLNEYDEFSEFRTILKQCDILKTDNSKDGWQAGDQVYGNLFNLKAKGTVGAEDATSSNGKATYLLSNFHYTLYAPTNAAMKLAHEAGLPTLDDLNDAVAFDTDFATATQHMTYEETVTYAAEHGHTCLGDSAARIKEVMLDFVKYHVQDNSIFIDKGFSSGNYETGKTELIRSTDEKEGVLPEDLGKYDIQKKPDGSDDIEYDSSTGTYTIQYYTGKYSPGRPYKLDVAVSSSSLTVNGIPIDTGSGLYNLMAREYWYKSAAPITEPQQIEIDNSSFVVIHAINKPLLYDAPAQFKYKYKPLTTVSE